MRRDSCFWRSPYVQGLLYSVLLIILTICTAVTAYAEENCHSCHGEEYRSTLEQSIHSQLSCSSCHVGFETYPHPKNDVNPKDPCSTCHSQIVEQYQQSVHGQFGHGCNICHENAHSILSTNNPVSKMHPLQEPETCGTCHKNSLPYTSYRDSFHGIANSLGSEKNATCADCHSSHLILTQSDPRSSVHEDNVAETCASCHGVAAAGFAQGKEHYEVTRTGYGAPMYWVMKLFTWLTIIVITLLVIHMELELYRRLINVRRRQRGNLR